MKALIRLPDNSAGNLTIERVLVFIGGRIHIEMEIGLSFLLKDEPSRNRVRLGIFIDLTVRHFGFGFKPLSLGE